MFYVSTTALANRLDLEATEMFEYLEKLGLIIRKENLWLLTELGIKEGGCIKENKDKHKYIAWPAEKILNYIFKKQVISSTTIKKHYHNITRNRINLVISELGWIEKVIESGNHIGWEVTTLGTKVGGKNSVYRKSGTPYVLWPEIILKNRTLSEALNNIKLNRNWENSLRKEPKTVEKDIEEQKDEFRTKFQANIRTKDGHYVRSRAELIIDNALYDYGLAHAYEKKLAIEEEVYTDFYLPHGKVYIEYWGFENNPNYLKRKKEKQELYKKYKLNLIELNDKDISNLDDYLPKKLLSFGIRVF